MLQVHEIKVQIPTFQNAALSTTPTSRLLRSVTKTLVNLAALKSYI